MVESSGCPRCSCGPLVPGVRRSWGLGERLRILVEFMRVVENWYVLPVALFRRREGSPVNYITRSGLKIKTRGWPVRVHLSDCYSIVENFGNKKDSLFRVLEPSDVVIDIGAHIGTFAVRSAKLAGRIMCFEPDPDNFAFLLDNLRQNSLGNANALMVAVASDDGVRAMTPGLTKATGTITPGGRGGFQVSTVSLQTAIEMSECEDIGLVKMDCEGAEYEILGGASISTLRKVRRLFVELHYVPGMARMLSLSLVKLARAGFDVVWLDDGDLLAFRKESHGVSSKSIWVR